MKFTYRLLSIFGILVISTFALAACGAQTITVDNVKSISTQKLEQTFQQVQEDYMAINFSRHVDDMQKARQKLQALKAQGRLIDHELDRRGAVLVRKAQDLSGNDGKPSYCGTKTLQALTDPSCTYIGATMAQPHLGKKLLEQGWWEKTDGGNVEPGSSTARQFLDAVHEAKN